MYEFDCCDKQNPDGATSTLTPPNSVLLGHLCGNPARVCIYQSSIFLDFISFKPPLQPHLPPPPSVASLRFLVRPLTHSIPSLFRLINHASSFLPRPRLRASPHPSPLHQSHPPPPHTHVTLSPAILLLITKRISQPPLLFLQHLGRCTSPLNLTLMPLIFIKN